MNDHRLKPEFVQIKLTALAERYSELLAPFGISLTIDYNRWVARSATGSVARQVSGLVFYRTAELEEYYIRFVRAAVSQLVDQLIGFDND